MDHIFDLEMALTIQEDITLSCPEVKPNDSDSDDETPVVATAATNSTSNNITIFCMKKTMITAASTNAAGAVCTVCMDGFISGGSSCDGGGQQLVSCGHVYHEDCITKWLSLHNSCPLCRSIV